MTTRKLRLIFLLLSSFGLLLSPLLSFADDYSNNIGFMKNPPKELKQKYPKCDQFLDVKWIKQFPFGNWVGTVTADVYLGTSWEQMKNLGTKAQKKLVVMQKYREGSSFNNLKDRINIFDVSGSTIKVNELESLIKFADMAYSNYSNGSDLLRRGFAVETNGKLTEVARLGGNINFSRYSQNICVTLPNAEITWIIENNNPLWIGKPTPDPEEAKMDLFKTLSAKECSRPNNEIAKIDSSKHFCSSCSNAVSYIRNSFVLEDVDGDGRMEYRYSSLIAFLNDNPTFLMKMPKECYYKHYNYDPQEELKLQRCIAEQKRKFLKNRKNDN